ncbi:MAG: type II secretion system F family protein [Pirellulaceae bacterium]|jgi:general secretion pathway protein F/type IV pilus assembly protein PilC|nr:type II secretion system F family protein [Pirellulaceae bacterium]
MPDFAYTARSVQGQDSSGVISAGSRREAIALLAERSLFPLRVEAQAAAGERRIAFGLRRSIKSEVLADTFTQLSDLLSNGVPLLESLDILARQAFDPRLGAILQDVRTQVADGTALDTALASHPRVFTPLAISMVRAGLEGAFLEEALERIASFLRKHEALRMKIIGSMTYPAILAVVGVGVTIFLVSFVVPMFQGFFDRLERSGTGLPWITVLLVTSSEILVRYGLIIGGAVVAVVLALRRWTQTPGGRAWMDRWKLKIPLAGKIFHDTAVARLCRVLGTLLRNGVPLLTALRISSESTGNRLLQQAVLASVDTVSSGDTLSRPLAACGLIPSQIMAMIRIAEEANTLDEVLVRVADRIDERIERQLDIMVRMVEPVMLLLIGTMVLFIIVGILLPVFDLNASIG